VPLLPPSELGLGDPPAEAEALLGDLETTLGSELPAKKADENLLIATWNIQALSRATKRWVAAETDDPKRNLLDLCCIATIISRFDVVAVVEIKRSLEALKLLMAILGPGWGFIVSDVSGGAGGNDERLGYLFDLERAKPSGLAGELVIPEDELDQDEAVLKRQFDRTPYTVSFTTGAQAFTLVSLHIKYGRSDEPELRTPELAGFARWMRDHADDEDEFNRNLIALGDFNIDRQGDPNWEAFVIENGLSPPDKLLDLPRTVGDTESEHSFYDQIAWFNDGQRSALTLDFIDAGTFIWDRHLLAGLPARRKEARISDHYPLWAEFGMGAG
jgi:exonuclease III